MNLFYKGFVVAVLVAYGAAGLFGLELGGGGKQQVPSSVRQSPGGYRSFHFWHGGIHGGK